jgi:hypothetical protein
MDVGMGHFQTDDGHSDPEAGNSPAQLNGHLSGKEMQVRQILILHIEDVVHFMLGNDKYMTSGNWLDIEKSKEPVVLRHAVTGNLSRDDAGE